MDRLLLLHHHRNRKRFGSYANTATSAAEADPTPGNNSATVTPVPVPQTNVESPKPSTTPNVGGNVIFTLTANKRDQEVQLTVSVSDVLPAGYTYVSNTTPSAGTLMWYGAWTVVR
jgi:uncharacterized repeat protein (TIGR01451 family)